LFDSSTAAPADLQILSMDVLNHSPITSANGYLIVSFWICYQQVNSC